MASVVTVEPTDAPAEGEATDPRGGDRRRRLLLKIVLALVFVVVATGFQLARQEGHPLLDTMWAEDGDIFLTQAYQHPSPIDTLRPYAGYLHLVPRSIALVTSWFPVSEAAFVTRLLAALTVSLLALYLYVASRRFIPSRVGRAFFAVLVVALPVAGLETNANSTNLHWYFFVACFFALLHRPANQTERLATWAVMIAATLSEGIVLLLIPVAIYQLFTAKNWRDRSFYLVFGALALAHLGVIVTDDSTPLQNGPVIYEALPGLYGIRVAGSLLIGERAVTSLVNDFDLYPGWKAAGITVVALAGLAAYIWWGRRELENRGLLLLAMAYSGAAFLAPTMGRGNTAILVPGSLGYSVAGSRYMVAPALLLATVLIALVSARDPRVREGTWRVLQGVALGAATVVLIVNMRAVTGSSFDPTWSDEVENTRLLCEQTGAEAANIPIPPRVMPWHVEVDCDRLT